MKIRSAGVGPLEVDMTPMIDIVFQLIAFFMVISNFEQNEADERITLPRDALAREPEVQRKNSVVLNFGFRTDRAESGDDTPYIFFGDERYPIDRVDERLRQESQFYKAIKTDLEDVTVEIRADAGVKAGMVQELMQLCQREDIQFQRFALKVTQQGSF